MLGLADRGETIGLFEHIMKGEVGQALKAFAACTGLAPIRARWLGDLLEHAHGASLAKALGPDALALPKDQAARLAALGARASAGSLSRIWQMLLKAHDEVRLAPDPRPPPTWRSSAWPMPPTCPGPKRR